MQDGEYEKALNAFQKGLKLPGSRVDVVRTQRVSGPSPVGGAKGGTNSETVQSLDEFEIQAAYYNMACAQAQLERYDDALASLRVALENGFDNLATVRSDPDLAILPQTDAAAKFDALLEEFESKSKNNGEGGGFFGLFQSKKK
ncbi:hypothetical protein FisN_16Hh313 [Fistulifera solaris]|uniref:Uncharacterized protein n=1 Tax=Fistulifera solaris TaxID=1519565 RepID=A0A1Z5KTK3_FISSO|nr:hypothetical protein FisN_16Hh313 [Fistulifera solaris]|eukprot:GAX29258.1 hypothetical protein FisN_16Hh313 [Fistulifera solaris]